jgi:hypothetical protein
VVDEDSSSRSEPLREIGNDLAHHLTTNSVRAKHARDYEKAFWGLRALR